VWRPHMQTRTNVAYFPLLSGQLELGPADAGAVRRREALYSGLHTLSVAAVVLRHQKSMQARNKLSPRLALHPQHTITPRSHFGPRTTLARPGLLSILGSCPSSSLTSAHRRLLASSCTGTRQCAFLSWAVWDRHGVSRGCAPSRQLRVQGVGLGVLRFPSLQCTAREPLAEQEDR
jgi:hypothetical protein